MGSRSKSVMRSYPPHPALSLAPHCALFARTVPQSSPHALPLFTRTFTTCVYGGSLRSALVVSGNESCVIPATTHDRGSMRRCRDGQRRTVQMDQAIFQSAFADA